MQESMRWLWRRRNMEWLRHSFLGLRPIPEIKISGKTLEQLRCSLQRHSRFKPYLEPTKPHNRAAVTELNKAKEPHCTKMVYPLHSLTR